MKAMGYNVMDIDEVLSDARSTLEPASVKQDNPTLQEPKITWKGAPDNPDEYLPKWVSYIIYAILIIGTGGFFLMLLWYL